MEIWNKILKYYSFIKGVLKWKTKD
jgi:hypothetical protein